MFSKCPASRASLPPTGFGISFLPDLFAGAHDFGRFERADGDSGTESGEPGERFRQGFQSRRGGSQHRRGLAESAKLSSHGGTCRQPDLFEQRLLPGEDCSRHRQRRRLAEELHHLRPRPDKRRGGQQTGGDEGGGGKLCFFAYFTDEERSSITDDPIWFFSRDRVYGPVHSNDTIHIDWDATSADPIFYGTVSTAKNSIAWSPRTPSNRNDWRRVLDGGPDALTLGSDDIPLPDSTDEQKIVAWGEDSGAFPSDQGVYLPEAGGQLAAGIYIEGDNAIKFAVDNATGNQIIYISQGSGATVKTTTVTVDLAGNRTTVVDKNGDTANYSGIPNGVIYTTGNITSLSGMLANNYENGSAILQRNAWTIATEVSGDSGKDIHITNNLQYKTEPDATKPATHSSNLRAATLGVVAEDIILDSSTPAELTIDGVLLAGGENTANGSFYNADYAGKKKNNLNVLGGVIQKKRGPVGTFNPSSNTLKTGYNKNYRYDTRMVDNPPPFFPTTGQFDVKSWQYL
jgi:hypothetical protein